MRSLPPVLLLGLLVACGGTATSAPGETDAGASHRDDGGTVPAPGDPAVIDGGGAAARSFSLLQANVGNLAFSCRDYAYKLCDAGIEDAVRTSIQAIHADVVALQEVSTPAQCAELDESDTTKVCHVSHAAGQPEQARRLVGAGYTIACSTRYSYECVAVRSTFGAIEGCADGTTCVSARTALPTPTCDDGFTVSSVLVRPRNGVPFTVVNGHPPSGFTKAAVACREDQVRRIFEDVAPDVALVANERSIVTGDFNLDPYNDDEASVATFRRHVGPSGAPTRFHYHSGIAEHAPPYPTGFTVATTRVLDHVASDFAIGTCKTLGEAPGTARLDKGEGTDHRALLCALSL